MIAEPPLLDGAVHVNETCELSAVPDTLVGAPGVVTGVTEPDVAVTPVPAALDALTLNVYAVPLTKPVIVALAVVDVPSANVAHEVPSLNSTT